MEYTPGELVDKCTILDIKIRKGLLVEGEFQAVYKEVQELFKKSSKIKTLYKKLFESNMEQYDLEDLVRVEKDLATVGKISLDIRKHNDNRVIMKNKINEILNQGLQEVKLYKRS